MARLMNDRTNISARTFVIPVTIVKDFFDAHLHVFLQ